jgi:hypothetical protein
MLDTSRHALTCMGYASFLDQWHRLEPWLGPLEADMCSIAEGGRERLVALQHLLVDLVIALDDGRSRYQAGLSKA